MSEPFESALTSHVIVGAGTVDRLGELAAGRGAARVLLVTDPGVVMAGHADRAQRSLEAAGVVVTRFDDVHENPSTTCVDRCLAAARACEPDHFVAVGGGSSLDTAKGADFLYTNGGRMEDYWGVGKASQPLLPIIAVPTTAGTGSETQSFALIAREEDHQKMACAAPGAAPVIAILDPELTGSMPRQVAAYTGLDALTHAVETAVTTRRTAESSHYSREAFRLVHGHLEGALEEGCSLADREGMLVAAAWAGVAIEHSMLGAAHACGNPLTARCGLVHGHAVSVMLPAVVRFNGEEPGAASAYHDLACVAGLCVREAPTSEGVECVARRVEELLIAAQAPSLAACEVDSAHVPMLAEEAARQWTAQFNPRPVGDSELAGLYRSTLERG
jgi:alcohol dehydrogenase